MSYDFDCLDIHAFVNVKDYYETPEVQEALEHFNFDKLLPPLSEIVSDIKDFHADSFNLICMYVPLLQYLYKQYSLLWSSVIIWNLLTPSYIFRTIKTDKIENPSFGDVHKFAEDEYYKTKILSLTEVIFGKAKIKKPIVLHKDPINVDESVDLFKIDIKEIFEVLKGNYNRSLNQSIQTIQSKIEYLAQNEKLRGIFRNLSIPEEINHVIRQNPLGFLNYLIWLHLLDDQWNYYYYIPALSVLAGEEETGGQTIAVTKELVPRDITKIMIINNIIHEPITRKLNKQLIKEANYELSEYPHIIGKYAFLSLKVSINYNDQGKVAKHICDWNLERNRYFKYLRGDIENNSEAVSIKEIWEKLRQSCLLIGKYSLDNKADFQEYCTKWQSALSEFSGEDIKVNAPQCIIMNILENLVSNSLKHSEKTIEELHITLKGNGDGFIYENNGKEFSKEALQLISHWRNGAKIIRRHRIWYSLNPKIN